MRYLLILPLFLFLSFQWEAEKKDKKLTFQDVLESRKVHAGIESKGGHQDECISFKIKNLTHEPLTFYIEPGRRLYSVDTGMQDIFIVKTTPVILGPSEEKSVPGIGYCCQSSNHSPSKKSVFTSGSLADENWVKVAKFIDKFSFFNLLHLLHETNLSKLYHSI